MVEVYLGLRHYTPMHSKSLCLFMLLISHLPNQIQSRVIAHVRILNKIVITVHCVIHVLHAGMHSDFFLLWICHSLAFTFSLPIWFFSEAIAWETEISCTVYVDVSGSASYAANQSSDRSQVETQHQHNDWLPSNR